MKNKFAAAFEMLAYGSSAHSSERYLKLSETTILKCLTRFCRAMVQVYRDDILRYPTDEECQTIADNYSERGFPGCIGCIDCAGWQWKNCPMALAGAYTGRTKKPTIRMEAICDSR